MSMLLSEYLKKLIATNKTNLALDDLLERSKKSDPDLYGELILIANNFSRFKKDKEKGILSREEDKLLFTQLNNQLLLLIDRLPSDWSVELSGSTKRKLNAQLFISRYLTGLLVAIGMIFLLLGLSLQYFPKQGLLVKIKVSSNRISFISKEAAQFDMDQDFKLFQLSNFEKISIPARQVALRENTNTLNNYATNGGLIEILPSGNNQGSFVSQSASLDMIRLQANQMLVFSLPESTEEKTVIAAIKPGNIYGEITFQDSLFFQCSHGIIDQLQGGRIEVAWSEGKIALPDKEPYTLTFTGKEEDLSFIIEPEENSSPALEQQLLLIDSLEFLRPNGPERAIKSSIIRAEFQFMNAKNKSYYENTVDAYEYLHLSDYKKMQLTSIQMEDGEIIADLIGQVGKVYTGLEMDELRLQNPSTLYWWYHNRSIGLVLLCLFPLLLCLALWLIGRKRYF